jgi:hypothetical protein
MFRRNPDLLAAIAVALYLFVGVSTPSVNRYRPLHAVQAREEITQFVKAELRSILRELALSIRPF